VRPRNLIATFLRGIQGEVDRRTLVLATLLKLEQTALACGFVIVSSLKNGSMGRIQIYSAPLTEIADVRRRHQPSIKGLFRSRHERNQNVRIHLRHFHPFGSSFPSSAR
jgi:hypothetical protein